jgi:hypothetical protein
VNSGTETCIQEPRREFHLKVVHPLGGVLPEAAEHCVEISGGFQCARAEPLPPGPLVQEGGGVRPLSPPSPAEVGHELGGVVAVVHAAQPDHAHEAQRVAWCEKTRDSQS